ncbi:glycosyltransferase family 4 protein [Qipengyuania sp. NPDC077410]|uniref:glycosyltransferase family 4 protein n=1 Tax=Qipengyuania sp. NPDC077410 TaxID=3364496 RepID=UPI0037CA79EA
MHILFITDNFPPEVNAPASRTYEHARQWVETGCEVTVITCAPNFPKGQVYSGYRNKLIQSEVMNGIRVVRVWTYITANEGFYKRTLDYLSFAVAATIASAGMRRPDVIVATSPQFFSACAGFCISLLKRRPWIFELRDIWPESIKSVGAIKEGLVLKCLEALEAFLYKRANRIIAVTHSFKRTLVERGVDTGKIDVVTNGADLSRFSPRDRPAELAKRHGLNGFFLAGYVGTHGLAHGLDTILDAAQILDRDPQAASIRILMLGHGARKAALMERAEGMRLSNVVFLDSVSKDQVADYWALLDASIIHLKKDPLFQTVIPSKLFECMAMGLPVLHGVAGESAEIVLRESVGETFEPENGTALADAILRMANDKKALARYRERCLTAAPKYDRNKQAALMLEALRAAAA